MFVDYSGKKPYIVEPFTGEVIEVELFVAVLGASSCTFAETTFTQQVPDWLASNTPALMCFGGVPNAVSGSGAFASADVCQSLPGGRLVGEIEPNAHERSLAASRWHRAPGAWHTPLSVI